MPSWTPRPPLSPGKRSVAESDTDEWPLRDPARPARRWPTARGRAIASRPRRVDSIRAVKGHRGRTRGGLPDRGTGWRRAGMTGDGDGPDGPLRRRCSGHADERDRLGSEKDGSFIPREVGDILSVNDTALVAARTMSSRYSDSSRGHRQPSRTPESSSAECSSGSFRSLDDVPGWPAARGPASLRFPLAPRPPLRQLHYLEAPDAPVVAMSRPASPFRRAMIALRVPGTQLDLPGVPRDRGAGRSPSAPAGAGTRSPQPRLRQRRAA